MCKKLIFLISLVLLLGLVNNASAQYDEIYWDDGDPCDHLWSSPENWDPCGHPVSIDPCLGLGDVVHIEPNTAYPGGEYPIIDDGVIEADPNTGSFVLAVIVCAWDPGDAYLTMTGGYIRIDEGWDAFMLGLGEAHNPSKGVFATGTLNMSGGLIELYGADLFVGDKGIGYLNMTDPCGTGGGIIDANGGQLALPGTSGWFNGSGEGEGHIDLEAGSIICGSIFMQEPSTIDINEGTLIIEGDARGVVTAYVENGWITGRGSADPRNVAIVYDDVNDITVVTYDPTPDITLPWRPRPLPGSTDANWKPTLSWEPGAYAETHTVYFGSSPSDVNESATPVSVNQVDTTYTDPNFLEFGQTYYWRIEEVNDPCVWPGPVWFFAVGDYVVVDDFDSYADETALDAVWNTGHLTNNGAELFLETAPELVRDGNSMRYYFRGLGKKQGQYTVGSEAEADIAGLQSGSDWTSAKALVLYFYGDPTNLDDTSGVVGGIHQDQMYVALKDGDSNSGIVKLPDMNDIKEPEWHEWNIDLADPCLADVNMANIAKVYIGFGGAKIGQSEAGAGKDTLTGDTVWFDDIRVYPSRCTDEFAPAGDITGECLVDYADVNALASDWLLSDYFIVVTAPPNSPVGWWKLDEGEGTIAVDSAGDSNGTHGGSHTLTWVGDCGDPCRSPCLDFDGVGYVDIPSAAFTDVNDEITVTLWQYGTMTPAEVAHVMLHAQDACDPYDLTIKCELWQPSATGCEVFFDAGYGGEMGADSVVGLAGLDEYQGQWNHYAFTKNANAGEMKIYLNGVLFADQGEEELVSPVTGTEIALFKLGSDALDTGTRRYTGRLSDVRLYNYVLSYGEVRHVAGQMDDLYVPLPNPEVDLHEDGKVNFKDYVVLANTWLVETFWP